jgi:peptide/nickel transport system permease protein
VSARFAGRRLLGAFATIVAIMLLNFLLFRLMPGSPERVLLRNPHLTEETVAAARERWGLDRSLPEQLVAYIGATATGDLGYSFLYRGLPVSEVIATRFWPTVILIGLAEVVAIFAGLLLGAYAGWRRGSAVDRIGNGLGLIFYSMPYFVIGLPLIIIFATNLGWFPTSGMLTPGMTYTSFLDQLLDFVSHLILPLTTIALGLIGGYSILMRSSVIETRTEDYVTTARAKGLSDGYVLRNHAFPNALLPTVTVIAINLGYVVAGALTAEIIFNWPGLGTLTYEALVARDYPVLQGVFLVLSVSVVVANLGADMVYGYLDPRVRA